ncbi:hypothetical protein SCA6_000977 [Theobroma cacao]
MKNTNLYETTEEMEIKWAAHGDGLWHVVSSAQVQLPAKRDIVTHIIKTKDDVLSIEFLEDNIRINRQMVWEITMNVKTDSLDNWKRTNGNKASLALHLVYLDHKHMSIGRDNSFNTKMYNCTGTLRGSVLT